MFDYVLYFFAFIGAAVTAAVVLGYLFFKLAEFLMKRRLKALGVVTTGQPDPIPSPTQ